MAPDPKTALWLVNHGVSLTAYKCREDGRKVPWAKEWAKLETLPIKTEHDIMSCIESGCHGFQMRAIDAGVMVVDIDRKGKKDGLLAIEQATKLHGVKLPPNAFSSGYIVKTPNDGYHIYLKPDDVMSQISRDGIIEGVDLICNRKKLVVVAGSLGQHKDTGNLVPYVESGHLDNAEPIPPQLSRMFSTIIDNHERLRKEEQERRMNEAMTRRASRVQFEGGSVFEEAGNRITRDLIETMFSVNGSRWETGTNGPEFWTLNPTRADNSIGSFSIRHDGIYSDFSNQDAGDFIDLLCKSNNMKPYEAACMIIRQTGGNPDDYKGKVVTTRLSIGKPAMAAIEPHTPSESFIDDVPGEPEQPKEAPPSLFPLKRLGEMSLEEEEWLVDRLFQADALSLVYGKSGVGKSFWALDVSLCIATGKEFHGNEVKQGPVVYMAGEGHKGIYKRALAWQKHHNTDAQNSPWWLAGKPFDLIDKMSVEEVLLAIDHHTMGVKPKLVVIDTLARNFGDGDENKASDMGTVIRNADAIRVRYECLVIIVHHSGHEAERARGSSALRAAVEFEYCVTQPDDNVLLVSNTKMKDGEKPADMNYRLTDIELGKQHKWGAEMKSAVLVEEEPDRNAGQKRKVDYLGKNQKHVLDTLVMLYEEHVSNLKESLMDMSKASVPKSELVDKASRDKADRSNVYKIIKELVAKKLVHENGADLVPTIG